MGNIYIKKMVILTLFALLALPINGQIREVKSSKNIKSDKYEIVDISFTASSKIVAPFEVEFTADFTKPDGEVQSIPAFYNGNNCWIVRFAGDQAGLWSYSTRSDVKSLSNKKGAVCVNNELYKNYKGAIGHNKINPQKFSYHNGEDYFMMGFECDYLFALNYHNEIDTPELDAMLDEIQRNRFNYLVMNVYGYDMSWDQDPKLKDIPQYYFGGREDIFPFLGSNSEPDYSALNVEYFQKLDRVLAKLADRDIVAHLMIYVWNKQIAWPELDSLEGNRYFDYVAKRYQAFPNLVWDISKEAMGYKTVDMNFISERIDRLRKLDSYKRLLTVHDYRYCSAYPDKVDIIVKQDWSWVYYPNMLNLHKTYKDKPSVNIEHGGYEMADYEIFKGGNYCDASICLRRNYEALFAGAYSAYYWQGTSWNYIIYDWFKDGITKYTPKLEYYKHMVDFFEIYPYSKLEPAPQFNGAGYCLSNGEGLYIYYIPKESQRAEIRKLRVVAQGPLQYRWFNTHTGEFSPMQEADSVGDFLMTPSPWYLENDAIFIIQTQPL